MSIVPTTTLSEWARLGDIAASLIKKPLIEIVSEPGRFEAYSFRCADLLVDLSKQRIDAVAFGALAALGRVVDLPGALRNLMDGAIVNTSERRPALHTALR